MLMNGILNVEMVLIPVDVNNLKNVVLNGNNVVVKTGQVVTVVKMVLLVQNKMNGIINV